MTSSLISINEATIGAFSDRAREGTNETTRTVNQVFHREPVLLLATAATQITLP